MDPSPDANLWYVVESSSLIQTSNGSRSAPRQKIYYKLFWAHYSFFYRNFEPTINGLSVRCIINFIQVSP